MAMPLRRGQAGHQEITKKQISTAKVPTTIKLFFAAHLSKTDKKFRKIKTNKIELVNSSEQ